MPALDNSGETARLLRLAPHDAAARDALFARHRERLRRMVRLRLDRRVPARFTSSAVLEEVFRDAGRRWAEGQGRSSFFLWLRALAGERIQAIHRQHQGGAWQANDELTFYRDAAPAVNTLALAGQLLGRVPAPAEANRRAELQLALQNALNQMDPLDREILALCHFEELTNDEAAAVLELDRGETSRRYLQAVKALHAILVQVPTFAANPDHVRPQRGPAT